MQNIENIIFDYGNVIFDIDFSRLHRAFTFLGIKNVDQVFAHAGQNKIFDAFDKGEITASSFRDHIRQFANDPALTDEQIDLAWNALLIGVPSGNHQLLQQVKQQYRLFLLSNNNEIHYQWIMDYLNREYQLADNSSFFEKDYYSHLLGMRKPDAEIFERVLNNHGLKPKETLFIDDSPQHLETARQLGLKTILASHATALGDLLKSHSLISHDS